MGIMATKKAQWSRQYAETRLRNTETKSWEGYQEFLDSCDVFESLTTDSEKLECQ